MLESNWYRQYYIPTKCLVVKNETKVIPPQTISTRYSLSFQNLDGQPTTAWSIETTKIKLTTGQTTSCKKLNNKKKKKNFSDRNCSRLFLCT